MTVTPTPLPGVLLIEPRVHRDDRGYFVETYHEERYQAAGVSARFVQDNQSSSSKDTLRGLHAQLKRPQAKLVRCLAGSIWDVAADMRQGSPTFGKYFGVELSAENFKQLYVPGGLLHGFCVLSERADVEYKCSDLYVADDQFGIRFDDPTFAIAWPVKSPVLSDKDKAAPYLQNKLSVLPKF